MYFCRKLLTYLFVLVLLFSNTTSLVVPKDVNETLFLAPNSVVQLDSLLSSFSEKEQNYFFFSVLNGLPVPVKETIKDVFSKAVLERLKKEAYVVDEEAVLFEKSNNTFIFTTSGEKPLFIKAARDFEIALALYMESRILKYLSEHAGSFSNKFPKYISGPKAVKINGEYYFGLVMERLENVKNLAEFVEEKKSLTKKEYLNLIWQFLEIMVFIQENRIVIRDIKAENILIQENEQGEYQLILIDFGLSHFLNEDPFEVKNNNDGKLRFIGTQFYFAPEEYEQIEYTFQQDLWKAGLIFYFLLSKGHLPFWEKPVKEMYDRYLREQNLTPAEKFEAFKSRVLKILNDEPYHLDNFFEHLSDLDLYQLIEIIHTMIGYKNPAERPFQNAESVMEELAGLIQSVFSEAEWKKFIHPQFYSFFSEGEIKHFDGAELFNRAI